MITREFHSWVETDTQANATATATRAAPSAGIAHYISGVSGTFEASVTGATLILKDGTTEVARWHVHDAFALAFPSPIKLSPATAANLELAASGSAGVDGTANLVGYTA